MSVETIRSVFEASRRILAMSPSTAAFVSLVNIAVAIETTMSDVGME